MDRRSLLPIAAYFFIVCASSAHSGLPAFNRGELSPARSIGAKSAQDYFAAGIAAVEAKEWQEAVKQFRMVAKYFPESTFAHESYYFSAVANYWLGEFETANDQADLYLKGQANPPYFEQCLEIKYLCAEQFRSGKRRRMFGSRQMPKIVSGKRRALDIYDDVIVALPGHPLAVKALYGKAQLLADIKQYRDAIDTYSLLTRRFPAHELAAESYLAISSIYLFQSQTEKQNPDLLGLAELNARKLSLAFPGEERREQVANEIATIKESQANGLYETAQFYERTKRPEASLIYYQRAVQRFPDTVVASLCREKLHALQPIAEQMGIETEDYESVQ